MKKALIIRYGAYGDNLIISPVIEQLKKDGYYIILNTNKRGYELYKHDNRINEFIHHNEEMPLTDLENHWKELKEKINPDYFCNFSGSIEQKLSLHPTQPIYVSPKYERKAACNFNYYEYTEKFSKIKVDDLTTKLIFTDEEHEQAKSYIKKNKYNVLWCLSGSGQNKTYPWTEYVMGSLIQKYPDINFITVGDVKCKLLENIVKQLPEENFTELCGEISIRISMLLAKYVDLVISPDTGVLHAAGMYETPKIGLLGHTTKENITKTFKNDYSIESNTACSPCFYLIYDHNIQCPIDCVTGAAWCMAHGILPEKVYEQVVKVREKHGNLSKEMSNM